MTKYMVLYNSTMAAADLMASASAEQMKSSMDEWIEWREAASKTANVDFGLPLQAVGLVTPSGLADSHNAASGYSIIEADSKEAVMQLLESHPHLKRQGATIDVLEMLAMPGL